MERKITQINPIRVIKDYAIGIYLYVSSGKKQQLRNLAEEGSSLVRMTAAHKTWFVADIFIDSAMNDNYMELDRAIQACEKDRIDIVVTDYVRHFGKSADEILEKIRRIKSAGKRVVFVYDQLDTEAEDWEEKIRDSLSVHIAEEETRSGDIRQGMRRRAKEGTSGVYGRVCYGYKKDEYGMLTIVEPEADTVRKIYDWYLDGESIVGIIKKLKEHGIKTSKGKDQWSKGSVANILSNRKYTGDVAIADAGGTANNYLYEEHHTGIISKEKYEAVQKEIASRSNIEITESGVRRKDKKYSSKRRLDGK